MSDTSNEAIAAYGWQAVPRDMEALLKLSASSSSGPAKTIDISSITLPNSELANKVKAYAQEQLPKQTFHHSMRVYYYGQAILRHAFPTWSSPTFNETYLLTCLLHDIGTTPQNISNTLMSFEFHGGFLSLNLLSSLSAPTPQAENVAESVIRHQDLGDKGTLTRIGALIQLATVFDNMGLNPQLVAKGTIESVVGAWPREGWSGCFARTIREENGRKPWAHTTVLGELDFPTGVENNALMAPYDD